MYLGFIKILGKLWNTIVFLAEIIYNIFAYPVLLLVSLAEIIMNVDLYAIRGSAWSLEKIMLLNRLFLNTFDDISPQISFFEGITAIIDSLVQPIVLLIIWL
mmetsp:Transcript_16395/g.25338  ORF Transcript_16395/g.25338 Transcript_16395/m.25338 type:complete len:102 (+) Transcript_16395:269-574(+)